MRFKNEHSKELSSIAVIILRKMLKMNLPLIGGYLLVAKDGNTIIGTLMLNFRRKESSRYASHDNLAIAVAIRVKELQVYCSKRH